MNRRYHISLQKLPKNKTKSAPKNKQRSTSSFEIEIASVLKAKQAMRSTTKFDTPRPGLYNVPTIQQSGKGSKLPRIVYV